MISQHQENIQHFMANISAWEDAYAYPELSFFAVRKGNLLHLVQGRIFLRAQPAAIPQRQFESESVVAGCFPLSTLGINYQTLINRLCNSEAIETPAGNLVLPIDSNGSVSTNYIPFHPEGLSAGNRLAVLMLSGAQRHSLIAQPDLDWELKAASEPYESLNELLFDYSLGAYHGDFSSVEVVATSFAFVDFASQVVGELAEPAMLLAKTANPDKCQLGYRVMLHGKVVERGVMHGAKMQWTEREFDRRGVGSIKIPSGSALQCFAVYAGHTQHQGWIADPTLAQNPRRASFEEFDKRLSVLKDFLFEEQKQRKDARDFEVGVAWLLWLLGFSTIHAGATNRTSEAADILATTPAGHMAIIECTTGHLKAESKLSKLVERAQTIRRRLDASSNHHLRLLTVIITALGKDEVKADLEQAQKLGVIVMTREDLLSAVNQTIAAQDADRIFVQAEESLHAKQNQLEIFPA